MTEQTAVVATIAVVAARFACAGTAVIAASIPSRRLFKTGEAQAAALPRSARAAGKAAASAATEQGKQGDDPEPACHHGETIHQQKPGGPLEG